MEGFSIKFKTKNLLFTIIAFGLLMTFGASSASAAWIPLEIGMEAQHLTVKGTKLTDYRRQLSWYDSDTVTYKVTYKDGYGKYHYRATPFNTFSTESEPTTYERLASNTKRVYYDYFSVTGVHETRSMTGSITLTR